MAVETFVLKAMSALLLYPTEELVNAVRDIEQVLRPSDRARLSVLLEELAADDLYALQERYVELFDRSRGLALHLFEHVHGEGRDRGQAMVDLAALYRRNGLDLASGELPDFLPLFLEFLATRPVGEARALLRDTVHILSALAARLTKRRSPYAGVFASLIAFAGAEPAELPPAGDPAPDDLAALDAAWEETAVTFGAGDALGSCPASCGGHARMPRPPA